MAASSGGGGANRRERDKRMSAYLKAQGIERTTSVCALCYRMITIESIKSRYTHICPGGRASRR